MAENIIKPKISVILPVYNGEKYLRESIDSILAQTFTDFELLLINDCSKDDSENIILSYTDPRIVYIKNEKNLGLIKTLNKGLELSKGEFIARMDADDISHPQRFEKQIAVFSKVPETGICGTWFTLFGEDRENKIIKHPKNNEEIKLALLHYCSIGHPTVMLRRNLIGDMRYDTEFQAAEDYELWTRMSRITKFYNIQESLLHYRFHETNISVLESDIQSKNAKKIIGNQLEYLGIGYNEDHIKNCRLLFAHSFPQLTTIELMKVIKFANKLEQKNREVQFYDKKTMQEIISRNLKKLFENAIKNKFTLIPFLLKNRIELISRRSVLSNLKLVAKIILKR